MSLSSHQRPIRGMSDVWLTPPAIIRALGPFDLDPCAAINQPWATAWHHYTTDDDGLSKDWYGFTWVNSPFGPEVDQWLSRLADHGTGIALVHARTETRWFVSRIWERADAVLFMHGRIHFHTIDGQRAPANSGAPTCLVGYGQEAVRRLKRSGIKGSLVTHWEPVAA